MFIHGETVAYTAHVHVLPVDSCQLFPLLWMQHTPAWPSPPLPPPFFCTLTIQSNTSLLIENGSGRLIYQEKNTHHTWRLASPLLWNSLTKIEAVQTDASVLHKVCDADAMAAVQRWDKSIWNTLLCIQFIIYLWWFTIGLYNRWKP